MNSKFSWLIVMSLIMTTAIQPAWGAKKGEKEKTSEIHKKSLVFNRQGVAAFEKGKYEKARKFHSEALRLSLSIDDVKTALAEYINVAVIDRRLSRSEDALAGLLQAYKLSEDDKMMALPTEKKEGLEIEVVNISILMATTLLSISDTNSARIWSERALTHCHKIKCAFTGTILNVLGRLEIAENNLFAARETINKALLLNRKDGDRKEEATSLRLLAKTAQTPEEALDNYQRALSIDRALGLPSKIGADLIGTGDSYSRLGKIEKAKLYYQRAHTVATANRDVKMAEKAASLLKNITER